MIFRFDTRKKYEDELSYMISCFKVSGSRDDLIEEMVEEYISFCEVKSVR